jgi:hypothetical protein
VGGKRERLETETRSDASSAILKPDCQGEMAALGSCRALLLCLVVAVLPAAHGASYYATKTSILYASPHASSSLPSFTIEGGFAARLSCFSEASFVWVALPPCATRICWTETMTRI